MCRRAVRASEGSAEAQADLRAVGCGGRGHEREARCKAVDERAMIVRRTREPDQVDAEQEDRLKADGDAARQPSLFVVDAEL